MTLDRHPLILIDATAVPIDRRGVGRYVDELIGALDAEIAIACQARDERFYRALAPRAIVLPQRRIERIWARLVWEQFLLPRVARQSRARVIHSPHYTIPIFTRIPRVVTFHDATFFSDPQLHTRFKRRFFQWWIRTSVRRASRVVVPSRATANELADYVGEPELGYRVIHHGVDRTLFHPPSKDEIARVVSSLHLGTVPWIVFLGTIEPRKNLPALIEAYTTLARDWDKDSGPVPTLAIAGGDGWGVDLASVIALVPARGRVTRLGYVDLNRVPALLGGSTVVVYPSLGEGFGLPVLEAMACGAAVLTTRRLALPEIGGDAVAYTEPDAPSIATALEELIKDPARRARLGRLGRARSEQFTWEVCATKHLDIFDETGK